MVLILLSEVPLYWLRYQDIEKPRDIQSGLSLQLTQFEDMLTVGHNAIGLQSDYLAEHDVSFVTCGKK